MLEPFGICEEILSKISGSDEDPSTSDILCDTGVLIIASLLWEGIVTSIPITCPNP
jgi:hypothetical protein